jgi:hypothetical protein
MVSNILRAIAIVLFGSLAVYAAAIAPAGVVWLDQVTPGGAG